MKNLLPVLAFVLLAVTNTQGQTVAWASQSDKAEFAPCTSGNFAAYREQRKLGTATRAGGIIASVGFGTTVVGLVVYLGEALDGYNNQNPNYQPPADPYATGRTILQVGGCIALVGSVIGIVGVVHDHNRGSGRWGVVAPKPHELGLAYNF